MESQNIDKRCKAIKPNSERCKGWAIAGKEFCFTHDPEVKEEREIANKRGGLAPKVHFEPLPEVNLKTPNDVVVLIEETINKVRAGEMSTQIATCIGHLAGQLIKAIELANLDQRISIVEKVVLSR